MTCGQRGHHVVAVYGGVGYGAQRRAFDSGAELVVACPGRLEDLLASGAVILDDVRLVVIDEADRMADMGFIPAVKRILQRTATDRQVLLFGATFDRAVTALASSVQREPVVHEIGPQRPDISATRHLFWTVASPDRANTTSDVIHTIGPTIVFCRTRHGADRLVKQLQRLGTTAAAIHGGRSQSQRDQALRSFARRERAALVATDVAARGVHVDGVDGVVHFDPPNDTATYIHRSGRTARAGATGLVVSLVDPRAVREARRLQQAVGVEADITPARHQDLASPSAERQSGHPVPRRHAESRQRPRRSKRTTTR